MQFNNFEDLSTSNYDFPVQPGIYCLRIKNISDLPEEFARELCQRKYNILYIGKAGKSLKKRLEQELLAKGHGTFFRSMGTILGYRPTGGTLKHGNNYKFSEIDRKKIINYIRNNLELAYVLCEDNLNEIEKEAIKKYCSLLNLKHNPLKLKRIEEIRAECLSIARGGGGKIVF